MSKTDAPTKNQNPLLVLGKISAILDSFSLRQPVLTLSDIRETTGMPTSMQAHQEASVRRLARFWWGHIALKKN